MQRGRLQVSDPIMIRGIQAALQAGWEPASRGKPMDIKIPNDPRALVWRYAAGAPDEVEYRNYGNLARRLTD